VRRLSSGTGRRGSVDTLTSHVLSSDARNTGTTRRSSDSLVHASPASSTESLPAIHKKGDASPGGILPGLVSPHIPRTSTASSSGSTDAGSFRSSSDSRPDTNGGQGSLISSVCPQKDTRFESVKSKYLENLPKGTKFCDQKPAQPKIELPARPRRLSVVTLGF